MRRKLEATEHQIQCAYIELVRMARAKYPDLKFLRAFPNGSARPSKINPKTGKRYSVEGQKLRDEGVEPGPLDIILPCRRGHYVGLWFEFKRPGEHMTDAQHEYADYLNSQWWYVGYWTDAEKAFRQTLDYLNGKMIRQC